MNKVSLHQVWLVFKREYRVRVRTRGFIISTFVLPLIVLLICLLIGAFILLEAPQNVTSQTGRARVVVVCGDSVVRGYLASQFALEPRTNYKIEIDPNDSASHREWLASQVKTSRILAYGWLNQSAVPAERDEYYALHWDNSGLYPYLHRNIVLALVRARLSSRGITGAEVDRAFLPLQARFNALGPESSSDQLPAQMGVYVLAYLLGFTLFMCGGLVMGSIAEEKHSRIVELLLVSTRAEELMGGKILGAGCVGLTQIGTWIAFGALLASAVPAAREAVGTIHFGVVLPTCFVGFFILGYLLYSTLFAIAGALAGGNQASAHWTLLATMPLLIALSLIPSVLSAPDDAFATVASMIPYFAPLLMSARIAAGVASAWQVALCFVLIVVTTGISWIACARIYRLGILMYGKRLSLREVARWARYA
jgi:ABC-2 type transport system permease protein